MDRVQAQEFLERLLGSDQVYFQAPPNTGMKYPAIVYERDFRTVYHADNLPYISKLRYQVTVIERNPNGKEAEKIAALPLSSFARHFVTDNLHHDIYDLYL